MTPRTLRTADLLTAQLQAMSWSEFETWIVDNAREYGWLAHHDRPARTEKGWRTAVQGDRGYPDITLVHRDRREILWVEAKTGKAELSKEQERWLEALQEIQYDPFGGMGVVAVEVWRPEMGDYILSRLSGATL
jgi:hypothetical protein